MGHQEVRRVEVIRVSRKRSYEQIVEQIRQQILSGKLKPGDRLPSTRELAEKFSVGRSSMREALSALKAMGLVDIRQVEGVTVRKFSADQMEIRLPAVLMSKEAILELLEARKALETSNARIAAEKRTEDDLRTFERILNEMELSLGDGERGEKWDLEFHLALAEATHNRVMVKLLKTISGQMEAAIRETRRRHMYEDRAVAERLWKEHRDIYLAIQNGDARLAAEMMERHLRHVEMTVMANTKLN
jgi:GntR family transcriptional repressor for pyruvate dehydrogenase complex